jgi:phosphatidylinositol glycan class C protein
MPTAPSVLAPLLDRHPIRETIITLILLHSLSPILRTLTEATTSDSIWPLSGVLFTLGLLLVDYSRSSDGRWVMRLLSSRW